MAAALKLRRALKLGKTLSRVLNRNFEKEFLEAQCRRLSVVTGSPLRRYSSQTATQTTEYRNIIKDTEKPTGESEKHEFQSETEMLLEIVAKSLYSDKEVFLRELISNASDAIEKLRYIQLTESSAAQTTDDNKLGIYIATDKQNRILTIQDTGIGMTREQLISNLGTIAHSGSKEFLKKLKMKQESGIELDVIGQFGVGFYSAFMAADKVEVYTKSYAENSEGLYWTSDGSGSYEVSTAEGVQPGTKIVMHLKVDSPEFCAEDTIKKIIKKYSNFVGSPIYVNGDIVNTIKPLWLTDPAKISPIEHAEFYRYIGNCLDSPRFILHYTIDAPLSIRALFYFPGEVLAPYLRSKVESGISLYSRKILIQSKVPNILPTWLRFVKGVVDSEDISLNLSRELLQNSALIVRLRHILTRRILAFLDKESRNEEEYDTFFKDYGFFLKEGVLSADNQDEKESIGKLLRFETSAKEPDQFVGLEDYCSRLPADQKNIYYLSAPSRVLAEQSPYYESLKKRNVEVLFCYKAYDELVLMQLRTFKNHNLVSAEKEMRDHLEPKTSEEKDIGREDSKEINNLIKYMKDVLTKKAHNVKITNRLVSHPCVVTVEDMAAARHFVRSHDDRLPEKLRYSVFQPDLEINPKHPLIQKLSKLVKTDPKLAEQLTELLFTSSMIGAGLVEDSRVLLTSMNDVLTAAFEKH